jgi:tetratricopeptide (TPR) repeat protein
MRWALLLAMAVAAKTGTLYELRGRLAPGTRASVWLYATSSPFEDRTASDDLGRFRFQKLSAGSYTLSALVPGRGEMRQTIEVGPSQADSKGRVELVIELRDDLFESHDALRHAALVSTRELAIPEQAYRQYEEAQKRLARRDVDGAVERLEHAVQIAPQFATAWNNLGTIAYQTRNYPRAEKCFRRGLEADPDAYEPLVNLGGVLINNQKLDEALQYNLAAVRARPRDALGNSQLGLTYFFLTKLDLAEKYLIIAKQIDPRHFSCPQLTLAQIHARRHETAAQAAELEEFLKYHPDWPEAARIRANVERLRAAATSP